MKKILLIISLIHISICFAANDQAEFDDWIVCTRCKSRTAYLCHGYYLEPIYPYPLGDKTEYPTKITSNSMDFINKGSSDFYGNVIVQEGNKKLQTNHLKIIHNEKTGKLEIMYANGNVKMIEPDLRIDGTHATVFEKDKRKIIYDSTYRIYSKHARGTSDLITIEKDNQMYLPNASYTTCAPKKNSWFLRAKKTKLDKETGRGEAWHSWLYIKNVRVFYWPYINFPIDDRRQTGFLMPEFHTGSSNGVTITAPFYWNLAPNYDALITPHLMAKRGPKIDTNFRYLTEHSSGSIKFNFLPDDRGYQGFRNKRLENLNGVSKQSQKYLGLRDIHRRFSFAIHDQTKFNKQFKSEIDYTRVGDDNYLFDFEGDIIKQTFPWQENNPIQSGSTYVMQPNTTIPDYSSTTSVRQKVEFQYSSQFGTTTTKVEKYQILHPFDGPDASETYRLLPSLDFQSNTFDLPNDFNWNFSGNYTRFKAKEVAYETPLSTGDRYHLNPTLLHDFGTPGWFIKPSVQLDITSYNSMKLNQTDKNANKLTNATRSVPIYSVDSGLIFERPFNIFNNSFSQTLEPRAYYLYVPKREQRNLPVFDSSVLGMDYYQVFRNNRYSSFDRISEANQLGLGVMSRFLTDQSNEEKASIGIGRILYFQDRIPQLNEQINNNTRWSPIAAVAKLQLHPKWNIEGNLVKENLHKTNSGSLTLQYIEDPTHVINFGYQFVRNDEFDTSVNKPKHTRTAQISSAWEIKPELRLIGKVAHDLNLGRLTNILFGVEKHGCCTIFRVVWTRHIKPASNLSLKQYENMVSLQFVLKGLTQVGNTDTGKISSEIPGYFSKDNEF